LARYKDSVCRLCRRAGMKLFLKGDRCVGDKCSFDKRSFPPGQHGALRMRGKVSEYGTQLREKQKARWVYGILEKQFRIYYGEAARKKGVKGDNLFRLLELRLDNVVFRSSFADSRAQARQMVVHNHVTVNGKKVNKPSFSVRKGDVVQIKEKSRKRENIIESAEKGKARGIPEWLDVELAELSTRIAEVPTVADIQTNIDAQQIVELYSK